MSGEESELASSTLGTKSYWDQHYDLELSNFEDHQDQGEIWFGKSAETRILRYFDEHNVDKNSKIIDFGCGNGSVLRRLVSRGYKNLYGIDYSPAAVELASKISAKEGLSIDFRVLDLLSETNHLLDGNFDFVVDKGTLDAMLLCDTVEREHTRTAYCNSVLSALKIGGKLIIVSCNFTREELDTLLTSAQLRFQVQLADLSTFTFGGKVGATTTAAVFEKIG